MLRLTAPRVVGVAGAAALLLALAACGESTNTSSTGNNGGTTINETAKDFVYEQTSFSVPAGATVTVDFKNDGSTTHSFTLDNGAASKDADPGASTTLSFTAPQSGTLTFHCKYHPTTMMGTITVGAGGGGASTGSGNSSPSSNGYGY